MSKKDKKVCEQCGEEFEAYPSEKRRFCSHECYWLWLSKNTSGENSVGWKGGKVILICEQCKDEFEVKPSRVDKARFCSRKCKEQWQSENRRGENGANWRGGNVKIICERCKEEFEVTPARADKARFCSPRCRGQWHSENFNGENSYLWKGGKVTLICGQCEGEFEAWPFREGEAIFCSAKCYGLWQSENQRGENNPSWRGGLSFEPYGPDWTDKLKEAVRKRDDYTCAISGDVWHPGQDKFPVHHCDYDKTNNDPNNLITLGPGSHARTNANRKHWQSLLTPIAKGAEMRANAFVNMERG